MESKYHTLGGLSQLVIGKKEAVNDFDCIRDLVA